MGKAGKKYKNARKRVETSQLYSLEDAVNLLKEMAFARFNETVEFIVSLGIDPKRSDQMVRGTVLLPHGTGKKIKVLVFCTSDQVEEAKKAGADYAGGGDLVEKIKGGWLDFDIAVAEKMMMREISRLGKILGPRGLMPSPKAGTVTDNIPRTVGELKAGKIEFKSNKYGDVQTAVGKISFSPEQLTENISCVLREIIRLKPAAAKGKYLRKVVICATMSPSLNLDTTLLTQNIRGV
ncbi:MAG: 50S ribosomal protein L1 [Candidatus Euphemobacter frigidus]|nr:50S ribosomal protein L1 [Candidatus Euphemobacter frigidus]